jgi:tRNA G18 (ribose-2'-O)-methylase SpoU
VFVVEGGLAVRQLLESDWEADSLLLSRPRAAALPDLVAAGLSAGAAVFVATPEVLAEVAGFSVHRGVLALGRRRPEAVTSGRAGLPVWERARLVAVIEGVNDHENLGALFRNAAAFGVGAALLDPTTADPLYRRAIRVSVGRVLRVPFARLAPWPEALEALRADGFTLVALTPHGDETVSHAAAALNGQRVATLVGAEGHGLSAAAVACADRRVRIPLAAGVDSLNVATAAAVAWHRLATVP